MPCARQDSKIIVTSYELRVESLKPRVEIQKCELKFKSVNSNPQVTSLNPRVTSSNPQITSLNLRVTISNPRVTSSNSRVTSLNPRVQESFTSFSLIIAS